MNDAGIDEIEKWGEWLADTLGLTNPETRGRCMGIFIPLARRLHTRTGATPEHVARRVLALQRELDAYRAREKALLVALAPPAAH